MEENNKLALAENIENASATEAASPASHPIKKLPLTHSLPAKVAAFILTVITAAVACASILLGMMYLTSNRHFYTVPKDELKRQMFETEACDNAKNVISVLTDPNVDDSRASATAVVDLKNIASMNVEFSNDLSFKNWSYDSGKEPGGIKFTFTFYDFGDGYVERTSSVVLGAKSSAKVTVVLAKSFTASDRYSMDSVLLDFLYSMRYMVFVIRTKSS